MRRILLLVCAVGVLMNLLTSNAATHSVDLDCSDFGFQAAAQSHRDVHSGDPDQLDDDDDGTACEDELPCPCDIAAAPPPDLTLAPPPQAAPRAPLVVAQSAQARVVRVIDGDTLEVRLVTRGLVKVKLIGIDAPARGTAKTAVRCGGLDATGRLKKLAFRNGRGRSVMLQTDPTQDREDRVDRLLAYVDAAGVDFARTMLSSGAALLHEVRLDFLRASTYRKAQASAKAARRGVWRRCGGTHTDR